MDDEWVKVMMEIIGKNEIVDDDGVKVIMEITEKNEIEGEGH